ncbi:MAG: hypothetical protein K2H43_02775 [Clostridia bacterium]|nr:hypothetical protein [Clostridia bacterium]
MRTKKLILPALALAMVFSAGALMAGCGGNGGGNPTYVDNYYVIDTSLVQTEMLVGQEIDIPISVTDVGEAVANPNYAVSVSLNGADKTADVYNTTTKKFHATQEGAYIFTFVMVDENGQELKNLEGNPFKKTATVNVKKLSITSDSGEEDGVTITDDPLSISFGQKFAAGTDSFEYNLDGVSFTGNFWLEYKFKDASFLSNSNAKIFAGFTRNNTASDNDLMTIGLKAKRFHTCVSGNWTDAPSVVPETYGEHTVKITRTISESKAVWDMYYDGVKSYTLDAGTQYTDVVKRVYFQSNCAGATVYDVRFSTISDWADIERDATDVFDLSETTTRMRKDLGYHIYLDTFKDSDKELLENATITFTKGDQDVTATVYDAVNNAFKSAEEGTFVLTVRAEKNGVKYESSTTIEVWEQQGSMYSYGEIDLAFGADNDHMIVGKNGAITFLDMNGCSTPKTNYLTNVTRNWDVDFTTKDLAYATGEVQAKAANIQFTAIITKNDNPAQLLFDDFYVRMMADGTVSGIGANSWGSNKVVFYAEASNGTNGAEQTDEFNVNGAIQAPATLIGEHSFRISCRTDENGIVTYYYSVDGKLVAKHNTSTFYGSEITQHNNGSTLVGFQVLSNRMNGQLTSLKITQKEYDPNEFN